MVPSLPPVLSLDPTANQFRLIYSTAIYHKLFHGAICAISSIDIWQPGRSSTSGSKSGLTPAAQVKGPKASGGTSTRTARHLHERFMKATYMLQELLAKFPKSKRPKVSLVLD